MPVGGLSLATFQRRIPAGAPFVPGSANNGLSVDAVSGKIVLGNNQTEAGNPAALLNNREIVAGAFSIRFVDDAVTLANVVQLRAGILQILASGVSKVAISVGGMTIAGLTGGNYFTVIPQNITAGGGAGVGKSECNFLGSFVLTSGSGYYNAINVSDTFNVSSPSTNEYRGIMITPLITNPSGGSFIRGVYYNPTIISLVTAVHVAWENVTGNSFFGSTSGSVVVGSNTLDASAILKVDSLTQGILLPRMTTTQKNAIVSPTAGLMIYDSTLNKIAIRTAAAWETVTSA